MRRGVYGNNEIVVPVKGFFTLLGLEVLNPFYVFQLFSFCLWISDDYVYYAMVILTMSACGIVMAVLQTRRVSLLNIFPSFITYTLIYSYTCVGRTSATYAQLCHPPM